MRKLPAAITGFVLVTTLSTPAWAAGDRPETRHHHRFSGRAASPDDGRRGDRTQHDDPSVLF
jgi:hypothetical protein